MERLRDAIAKARAAREGRADPPRGGQEPPLRRGASTEADAVWERLATVELDDDHLADERIITWRKSDPSHVAFDVLRTRLLRLMQQKGWRRVLVTSPSKGCGKTTVSTNLAISLARGSMARTLLVDFDLKTPRIARRLGLGAVPLSIRDWLVSDDALTDHVIRVGENLALCLNNKVTRNSAELLQDPHTAARLDGMISALDPAAVIFDTPPMLVVDDAIGLLPQIDGVLLVAAAGQTTAAEIDECERMLEGTNFLGVLLNKCELPPSLAYRYYEYDQYHQS